MQANAKMSIENSGSMFQVGREFMLTGVEFRTVGNRDNGGHPTFNAAFHKGSVTDVNRVNCVWLSSLLNSKYCIQKGVEYQADGAFVEYVRNKYNAVFKLDKEQRPTWQEFCDSIVAHLYDTKQVVTVTKMQPYYTVDLETGKQTLRFVRSYGLKTVEDFSAFDEKDVNAAKAISDKVHSAAEQPATTDTTAAQPATRQRRR
jgi:hypothetical protein